MAAPRIAFVTGHPARWRAHALAAKYGLMRWRGLTYPDVYSIPFQLADRFDFLREGARVPPGRYDLVISELNRAPRQLQYIDSLIATGCAPVAIVPGPPELLLDSLTESSGLVARRILRRAAHVWAYSEAVKAFADAFADQDRARLIPWPFDFEGTRRLAGRATTREDGEIRVLLNAPLRFSGPGANHPAELRSAVTAALSALPAADRTRVRFSTYLYSASDREEFRRSGYGRGLPIRVEGKRGYASFLRFLAGLHGVVNLTSGGVLGRITFLAAALERPGLFSDNSEINRALYPGAVVPWPGGDALDERLARLIASLARGAPAPEFSPDLAVASRLGDLRANGERFRRLVENAAP